MTLTFSQVTLTPDGGDRHKLTWLILYNIVNECEDQSDSLPAFVHPVGASAFKPVQPVCVNGQFGLAMFY